MKRISQCRYCIAAGSLSSSFCFFEQFVKIIHLRGRPKLIVAIRGLDSHIVLRSGESALLGCNEVWILRRSYMECASSNSLRSIWNVTLSLLIAN